MDKAIVLLKRINYMLLMKIYEISLLFIAENKTVRLSIDMEMTGNLSRIRVDECNFLDGGMFSASLSCWVNER